MPPSQMEVQVCIDPSQHVTAFCAQERINKHFPLEVILRMYCVGRKILYLDYLEGFKLLADWLGPFDNPCSGKCFPIQNWYEANYEVNQLAKILEVSPEIVSYLLERIYNEQYRP